jgi:predicted DNA-binding helix-hairpin-helix protein
MLDLKLDPKLAWALAHRERFPVDINRASREELLRVPGLGVRTVERLLSARRHRRVRMDDLARLRLPLAKLAPFVATADHRPRGLDSAALPRRLTAPVQADLFG